MDTPPPGRGRCNRVPLGRRAAPILIAGATLSCAATPWQGTELDPAALTFATELAVDLSRMEQIEPGLYVRDVAEGAGAAAGRISRVWIHYVAWLPDGTVVDTSIRDDPFHFRLGGNEVIEGWNRAIPGMKVGGRRTLVVRPGLAYGSRGTRTTPPNSTLVFEVELVDTR